MADIKLVIKADALQAEKDFQSFGNISQKVKKDLEEFQKAFDPKTIDDFIAKNKLAALGVTQTQGPLKGLTAETKGYEKQIRTLISSGLSPQSAEIQKLQAEYVKAGGKLDVLTAETKRHNAELKKHNEGFSSGIKSIVAYAAAYISLRGVISTVKALTNGLAEQGDEAAKNSIKIGITAESYQELKYAADLANVSGDAFSNSMQKLTKNIGEAKTGSGTLASFLKKVNPELLAQVKAAGSSEEAMKLLSDEIAGLGNAQDRAALATAAFGKSGMELLPMLENGSKDISKLQAEARKYGFVMSDEAAKASEEFLDSQTRLGYAVKGLIVQIGGPLIKPLTEAITAFTEWASEGDNLYDTLKTLGYILAGATSGLIAFLAVTKGVGAVQALSMAFKGLTAVIAANPIGAIAVLITAVLVPAIIWMVKNWELVKYKVVDFGIAAQEKMLELGLVIREKVMGSIIALLDKMSQISGAGEIFKKLADSERNITEVIKTNIKIVQLQREINKKSFELSEAERQKSIESNNAEAAAIEDANKRKGKSYGQYAEDMKAALALIAETENMKRIKDIDDATKFFEQRAEMESADFEKRMEFLQVQQDAILTMEGITAEQRINMQKGITAAIENENKKRIKTYASFGSQFLGQTSSLLTDLQAVLANAGKESRKLAIAMKAVAVAQAIVNTFLGVTGALTILPPPVGWAMAAVTMASGLAAVARIVTTPIPSGQTGLQYTVPDIPNNRNDHHAVNASAGEKVSITPRGEDSQKTTAIDINIGEDTLFSIVQRGFDTGKLTFSDKNIRGGVFA